MKDKTNKPIVVCGSNYGEQIARALLMANLSSNIIYGLNATPAHFNEKPLKKCLLSGCENLTDHNKGYCSAICFKKSRLK